MYLITFGSPQVGDEKFIKYFKSVIPPLQVTHYITSYPSVIDLRDMVANVPPKQLGYRRLEGMIYYIKGNLKYAGNPTPIKGIEYVGPAGIYYCLFIIINLF
jgi:hypothetical protein